MQITEELLTNTYLFCYKRLSDKDKAQDLAQEIILEALRVTKNENDSERIKNFYAWYWQMAYNKIVSSYNKKEHTIPVDYADTILFTKDKTIEELIGKEEIDNLSFAISHLAQIHREVIIRFYLKNQSLKQIAKDLDIPIGTVKGRLFDAKKDIKVRMKKLENQIIKKEENHKLLPLCFFNANKTSLMFYGIDSLLAQQVLYSCRMQKKSINEIADDIDASPIYIESIIKKLIKTEMIIEPTQSKYLSNIILLPDSCLYKMFEVQNTILKKINFEQRFYDIQFALKDKILSYDFYGKDFDYSFLMWYFSVRAIKYANKYSGTHYCLINGLDEHLAFQERPSHWINGQYCTGKYPVENVLDKYLTWIYYFPGFWTPKTDYFQIHVTVENPPFPISIQSFGDDYRMGRSEWINAANGTLLFDLVENPAKILTEAEQVMAAEFIKHGVLTKTENGLRVNIPFFTFEHQDIFDRIWYDVYKPLFKDLVEELNDPIHEFVLPYVRKDLLPAFYTSEIKNFTQPLHAVINYGVKNKILKIPEDYERSTAGMVILRK